MSGAIFPNRNLAREPHSNRGVSRRALVLLLVAVLLMAAVPAFLYMQSLGSNADMRAISPAAEAPVVPIQPADRFMQSIVNDDGALGWHQLCPSLQAQLPMGELVQQANAQRTAAAQQGVWLTLQFVGTRPRQGGGAQRTYLVTAHWPNGLTQTRTFTVLTQSSGCVEDVQNQ